jgi:hypothetical protein
MGAELIGLERVDTDEIIRTDNEKDDSVPANDSQGGNAAVYGVQAKRSSVSF